MTTSGGQAELILDVATSAGIPLHPLPAATREAVERDVGRVTGDGNPLDAWGRGDFRTTTPQALRLLSENPATDAIVFCSSDSVDNQALGRAGREEDYARLFAEAAAKSTKPHYFMSMRPGVMHSGQIRILAEAGVAVIGGTRQGLGAIERLARWNTPLAPARAIEGSRPHPNWPRERRTINEFDAKRILAGYGLPVTRETFVTSLARRDRGRDDHRLSGGAEGRCRRHPAQIRARSGRCRPCATSERSPPPSTTCSAALPRSARRSPAIWCRK